VDAPMTQDNNIDLKKLKRKPNIYKKPSQVESHNFSSKNKPRKVASNDFVPKSKEGLAGKIEQLESELELLTSYSTDTIYRLDYRTMKYDYISPAITRLLGFTPQEMKKINFRSLIIETKLITDGNKKVSSFEEFESKRIGGDIGKWQADYLIRTKSGDRIWVSDVSHPWFDNNGKIIGSVGSLREVNDRVRLEENLQADLEENKTADGLTGLFSKAEFFKNIDLEIKRSKRNSSEFSLIIFDVDNLAKINASEGFANADKLLHEIAETLCKTLRETDVLARVEGGTFCALLPDTEMKGAYWVAERVRERIINSDFKISQSPFSNADISLSAGIATSREAGVSNAQSIYKLADTRLYIAKNTGKNQVSIDEIHQMH
jgi:diguanylate cyclase (GGDEF)-like protein/PAS domain S-box-containing protein